jgi:hypothetical protein
MIRRRLSCSAISAEATAFRWENCPLATGAIELEEIMELDLRVEIVPETNLLHRTGGRVGSLSANGREIRVDAAFQSGDPREYRSFLAHELAHRRLHMKLVPGRKFVTREAFVSFHELLDTALGSDLEYEARRFGAYLLMPKSEMLLVFKQAVDVARDRFSGDVHSGPARMFAEKLLADHFGVSEARIAIRAGELELWQEVRREQRWRGFIRTGLTG